VSAARELLRTSPLCRNLASQDLADGREVILEIFGPGAPVGAVVVLEGGSYPASSSSSTALR
jgi:CRP-like cAMP-binding protein